MLDIVFMTAIGDRASAHQASVNVERTRAHPMRCTPAGAWRAIAAVGLLLTGCAGSETHTVDTAILLPEDLGHWVKKPDPVIYDRENIFDYINGAGEVYRSYAFDHLTVARYENPDGLAVRVELFDMGNPADAYGVYSYALEEEESGIGSAFVRGGSVLCFWQDRFYVCVAAEQREPDPGPIIEELARGISRELPEAGARPPLVDLLPTEGLRPLSERYFHLHYTLNYHYDLARENVLNLSPATDAVLGRYGSASTILLIIDYGDEGAAGRTLASFRQFVARHPDPAEARETQADETDRQALSTETWKYVSSARQGRYLIVALNGEDEAAVEALIEAASANIREASNKGVDRGRDD